jgi:hypothetical protein
MMVVLPMKWQIWKKEEYRVDGHRQIQEIHDASLDQSDLQI